MAGELIRILCLLASLRGDCMGKSYVRTCSGTDNDCITYPSTSLLQVSSRNSSKQYLMTTKQLETSADIGKLHYLPEKRFILCVCAKCGTTSVHQLVYQLLFGKEWNYTDQPWAMAASDRWEGQLLKIDSQSATKLMESGDVFSLAIVRDPRLRLESAWRSKAACKSLCPRVDPAASSIVPELLALAGNSSKATCLSFSDFIDILWSIHSQGRESSLNCHFLPQHLGCIGELPRAYWSMVSNISDSSAAKELGEAMGYTNVSEFPHKHKTLSPECYKLTSIFDTTRKRLEIITKAEYVALGMSPATEQNDF